MSSALIIKLVKLANNNPNENEANLAARKACKMLEEAKFNLGSQPPIDVNRGYRPPPTPPQNPTPSGRYYYSYYDWDAPGPGSWEGFGSTQPWGKKSPEEAAREEKKRRDAKAANEAQEAYAKRRQEEANAERKRRSEENAKRYRYSWIYSPDAGNPINDFFRSTVRRCPKCLKEFLVSDLEFNILSPWQCKDCR